MTQSINIPSDESPYWIESALEVKYLFKALAKRGEKVTFWVSATEFIITMILDVLDNGDVIFDVGVDRKVNAKILSSPFVILSGSMEKVDIKCIFENVREEKYQGAMAFVAKLPAKVHKLQRREFYRVATPIAKPVFCQLSVPLKDKEGQDSKQVKHIPAQVIDISLGGICIMDPSTTGVELTFGMILKNSTMILPEFGQIQFDLLLCHVFEVEMRGGIKKRRAGCKFLFLSHQDQTIVQKYMTKLERDRRAVAA